MYTAFAPPGCRTYTRVCVYQTGCLSWDLGKATCIQDLVQTGVAQLIDVYPKVFGQVPPTPSLVLPSTSPLLWIPGGEGRKEPAESLCAHLETAPSDIIYDLHVVFTNMFWIVKGSVPKTCMMWYISWIHPQVFQSMYTSSWLQCLQSENYEMREQFNSFMQCVKRSATQMSQKHLFVCNFLLINGIQGNYLCS